MAAKRKAPTVKVELHYRTKQRLTVNGKTKLVADKINAWKLFDENNKIAIVYKDGCGQCFAVIHLREPISEFIILLPPPKSTLAIRLSPNKKTANVPYLAEDNQLYIANSITMVAERVIEQCG